MDIYWIAATLDPGKALTREQACEEVEPGILGLREALTNVSGLGTAHAAAVYDYAVEGAWPGEDTELFQDMAAFCRLVRGTAELYGTVVPVGCERFMAMAILRARLDAGTGGAIPPATVLEPDSIHFTMHELAVLAQMNERSVRNATLRGAPDPLRTVRVGTRVLVSATDAKDWLLSRRSFKPTQLPKKGAKR